MKPLPAHRNTRPTANPIGLRPRRSHMDPRRFLRRSRTATLRPRFQPQLEALEERLVMNNRFVVPLAQADNVTKFATLQAALKTAVAGDVIQIEKGAVPGDIADADVPEVANLTIQG